MPHLLSSARAHIRILGLIAALALVVLVFALRAPHASVPAARAVSTALALHADVSDAASFTGTLEPVREVDLGSKSGGLVAVLAVDMGTRVARGATIAVLDASQARAAVAGLSDSIAAAEATLSATEALFAQRIASARGSGDVESGESARISTLTDAAILGKRIDETLGTLFSLRAGAPAGSVSPFPESDLSARDGQAKIAARTAIADFQRADAAFQDRYHARILASAPSQEEVAAALDDGSALLSAAKTALSAAYTALAATVSSAAASDAAIAGAKQEVGALGTEVQALLARVHDTSAGIDTLEKERDAKLAEARAQIAQLSGEKRISETQLQDGTITAPFGGVITEKLVERGAIVGAGTPLVHLVDDSSLKLIVGVPDADARRYRLGDAATVLLENGATAQARISRVSPSVDAASRKVLIELMIPNASHALVAGTYARALFETARAAQVAIPRQALYTQYGTSYVFVAEDGVAHRRVVELGALSETLVEVLRGVSAGETVVTSGVAYLRDGDRIATEATAHPAE